jgi:hypothetical protein
MNVSYYFKIWQQKTLERKIFNELKQEERDEDDFACENDLDPIYWCWHCKYGCCDRHN